MCVATIRVNSKLPVYFVINPSHMPGVRTMQDFIAYAKANPAKVNIATAGTDLGYRLFNYLAGTNIQLGPFKGEAPALQAVLAGDAQMTYGALPSVQAQAAVSSKAAGNSNWRARESSARVLSRRISTLRGE